LPLLQSDISANSFAALKGAMATDPPKPPTRGPMPGERETLNPAPDKDYSREQPSTEGEENDPEIEDE
jgi:hypothetical protein